MPSSPSPQATLRGYFHAKDGNRPHLLSDVFGADAQLRVTNGTSTIAFPGVVHGREAIAETLVRRFNQTYENIYSFYMAAPPADATRFDCDWLVGMTEKDGGWVRVGCGHYEWTLQAAPACLATQLHIRVEAMQVLPSAEFEGVFAWLRSLDYPWTSATAVLASAPRIASLAPVLRYLGRSGAEPSLASSRPR